MEAVQLTAGLDTIYLFKKKAFSSSSSDGELHTNVLSGKNVVKDPLYSVDFNLFSKENKNEKNKKYFYP